MSEKSEDGKFEVEVDEESGREEGRKSTRISCTYVKQTPVSGEQAAPPGGRIVQTNPR